MLTKCRLRGVALALTVRLVLAVGAGAALPAPTAAAQVEPPRDPVRGGLPEPGDGFDWERVGDVGIDVFDLAFSGDGTLWANGSVGMYYLDLSGGPPGVWVHLHDSGRFSGAVLPLGGDGPSGPGPDTLLATTSLRVERSTDGGLTWEEVYYNAALQGGPLYEVPTGYPHAGRLLAASYRDGAYSDDRGTTWVASEPAMYEHLTVGAEAFLALPPASQHPGRLVAGTFVGAALSDDGGETWRPSGLWRFYHNGEAVALTERPDEGGVNALLGGYVTTEADNRAWVSADEGETWGPGTGGVHLLESPPTALGVPAVLSVRGASALVVLYGGTVYRTDDAGETWEAVGRAPEVNEYTRAHAAAVGPDGRLYVGLHAGGSERAWVWRTNEVVTASEPGPEAEGPEGLGLEVRPNPFRGEAQVTLTLSRPSEVSAALYDVLGRRVALLAPRTGSSTSGRFPAGHHELPLDAGRLPAGVYVVRVTAGGAVATTTVTLLR